MAVVKAQGSQYEQIGAGLNHFHRSMTGQPQKIDQKMS
jgi:hypothetical protein